MLGLCLVWAGGMYFVARAYGLAQASVVAPFEYASLPDKFAPPEMVTPSRTVTLLLEEPFTQNPDSLKKGAKVQTDQKLAFDDDSAHYVISSVTGTILGLTAFAGDYGRQFTAIEIEVATQEALDNTFEAAADAPTLDTLVRYLNNIAGNPAMISSRDKPSPSAPSLTFSDHDAIVRKS